MRTAIPVVRVHSEASTTPLSRTEIRMQQGARIRDYLAARQAARPSVPVPPPTPIFEKIHPLDEEWLDKEIYNWLNFQTVTWHEGHNFARSLFSAVLASLKNDQPTQAEQIYSNASGFMNHPHLWPHLRGYAQSLLNITRSLLDTRRIPKVITKVVNFHNNQTADFHAPDPSSDLANKALEDLMDEITRGNVETYKAERSQALIEAKRKLLAGEIDSSRAPELAQEAMILRDEVKAQKALGDQEIADLEAQRDQLKYKVAKAKGIPEGSQQLAGFSKSWKRIRKQIKRSWDDVVDPVKDLRDWVSHNLLPAEARRLGKKIENEAKRFGRRIDKQFKRGIEDVIANAPWIKAIAPFFGLIPGVGWIFVTLISATLATVEIGYALEQKKKLDDQLRKAKKLLLAEIADLNAEIARLNQRTTQLNEQRQITMKEALQESFTRVLVRRRIEGRVTWRRRGLVAGSLGVLLVASRYAKHKGPKQRRAALTVAALGIGAMAAVSIVKSRKDLAELTALGENNALSP